MMLLMMMMTVQQHAYTRVVCDGNWMGTRGLIRPWLTRFSFVGRHLANLFDLWEPYVGVFHAFWWPESKSHWSNSVVREYTMRPLRHSFCYQHYLDTVTSVFDCPFARFFCKGYWLVVWYREAKPTSLLGDRWFGIAFLL